MKKSEDQKRRGWIIEKKKKSPFDVIAGYSVNEGLGEALRQNEAYIAVQKKIDEQTALLDGQNLTRVEGTTKNEKARKIKLTEEALNVLKQIKTIYGVNDDENARIVKTRTGNPNTATNLEHGMATIFRHAGLTELKGGLHIFHRTFATRMYENGARVKEIAAYIGDLESTTEQYYIAVRKKLWRTGRQSRLSWCLRR